MYLFIFFSCDAYISRSISRRWQQRGINTVDLVERQRYNLRSALTISLTAFMLHECIEKYRSDCTE